MTRKYSMSVPFRRRSQSPGNKTPSKRTMVIGQHDDAKISHIGTLVGRFSTFSKIG